ncbi:hypothetical protein [Chitinophaga skermanii]|nr:hypothetical protein [Chitinophaga skermanii]
MIVNYKKVGIIELNESRIVVHANEHRVVHDIPGLTTIEIFVLEVEGERNGRMSFANGSGNYLELGVDRTIIKYQFFLAEEHVVLLRNLLDSWRQHKVSFTAKSASRFRIH